MPRVVVAEGAVTGLGRCRRFPSPKSPRAAANAAEAIARRFPLLETTPAMGRPYSEVTGCRELIIPFGDSGYVALYRHDVADDAVYVLAFRHQKEAGY